MYDFDPRNHAANGRSLPTNNAARGSRHYSGHPSRYGKGRYAVNPYALRVPSRSNKRGARGVPAVFSVSALGVSAVFAVVLSVRCPAGRLSFRFRFGSRAGVAAFLVLFRAWRRFWRCGGRRRCRVGSVGWCSAWSCVVRVFAPSARLWLPAFAPSAVFSFSCPVPGGRVLPAVLGR